MPLKFNSVLSGYLQRKAWAWIIQKERQTGLKPNPKNELCMGNICQSLIRATQTYCTVSPSVQHTDMYSPWFLSILKSLKIISCSLYLVHNCTAILLFSNYSLLNYLLIILLCLFTLSDLFSCLSLYPTCCCHILFHQVSKTN